MKLSNWDNWSVIFDNAGNKLHGKLLFSNDIFDVEGNPLPNPIYTNDKGQTTTQVFVEDNTVGTVEYWKYIGNGTMESDEELENWVLEYTSAYDNVKDFEFSSTQVYNVNTIQDLTQVKIEDSTDGIVCVLGYYEVGDTEPVFYKWNPNSTVSHDYGSIIKSERYESGRWELIIPGTFIDSTHFGVFPQESKEANVNHTVRIANLFAYCNANGLFPTLLGKADKQWFIIKNVSLVCITELIVNQNTRISATEEISLSANISGNTDELFYTDVNGVILTSDVAYTSWITRGVFNVSKEVHINNNTFSNTWENITVYIENEDVENQTFDNCNIIANTKIRKYNIFKNMPIKQYYFGNVESHGLIDDTCSVSLSDFTDTTLWLVYKNMQSNNIFDFENREVDYFPVTKDSVIIRNAKWNVNIGAQSQINDLEFNNCDVDGYLTCESVKGQNSLFRQSITTTVCELNDCTITGDVDSDTLKLNRCNSSATVNSLNAEITYSTMNTLTSSTVNISNSTLSLNLELSGIMRINLDSNYFNSSISILNSNNVSDNSVKVLSGTIINNTVVSGKLFNWNSLKNKFIEDDRQHIYFYSNNKEEHELFDYFLTYTDLGSVDTESLHQGLQDTWNSAVGLPIVLSSTTDGAYPTWRMFIGKNTNFKVDMFAFGTRNIGRKTIKIVPVNVTNASEKSMYLNSTDIRSRELTVNTSGKGSWLVPMYYGGQENQENVEELQWNSNNFVLQPITNFGSTYLDTQLGYLDIQEVGQAVLQQENTFVRYDDITTSNMWHFRCYCFAD